MQKHRVSTALHAGANKLGPVVPNPRDDKCAGAGTNNLGGLRVPCGGKRRNDGQPCEALSVPGKRRCKWHGGCSTGPRTAEGKAKVTANLRARG